jgi:hypothetical protein
MPSRKLTPEEHAAVSHVFSYHPPSAEQAEKYDLIRQGAKAFAEILMVSCPPSADRTAALRKVREAVMTANAAIALEGRSF